MFFITRTDGSVDVWDLLDRLDLCWVNVKENLYFSCFCFFASVFSFVVVLCRLFLFFVLEIWNTSTVNIVSQFLLSSQSLVVFFIIAKTRNRGNEMWSFYFFKMRIRDKPNASLLDCNSLWLIPYLNNFEAVQMSWCCSVFFRSHEPSLTQNVTASPITTIAPHQVSSKSVKVCVSLIIGEMSYKLCEVSNFEADCSLRGSINQQYAIIEQQFSNCQTTSI